MRSLFLALALCSATAWAAPELTRVSDHAISVDIPSGWKHAVYPKEQNLVTSLNPFTNITVYWYRHKPKATADKMLDTLLKVTNENLPLGEATEVSRAPTADGRGKQMLANFSTFGYTMKLGFVATIEPEKDRMLASVLIASPSSFDEIDGLATLAQVTSSLDFTWPDAPAEATEK